VYICDARVGIVIASLETRSNLIVMHDDQTGSCQNNVVVVVAVADVFVGVDVMTMQVRKMTMAIMTIKMMMTMVWIPTMMMMMMMMMMALAMDYVILPMKCKHYYHASFSSSSCRQHQLQQ
jgi:hypothetical protein